MVARCGSVGEENWGEKARERERDEAVSSFGAARLSRSRYWTYGVF